MRALSILPVLSLLLAAACSHEAEQSALPGGSEDESEPFAGISESETLRLVGTEPFWGGEVAGTTLRYSTPEHPDGQVAEITRFAGRGGLSFSGTLEGRALDMMVTPGRCSDGMSDRTFPFAVTLKLGEEQRQGCAWTDAQPYEDPGEG